ncbi:MAG TPA: hypothetical protein VFQ96_03285 [Microbacteriaceae bacterium]|nr:hypothetical protein [Microbacteriaceae bacterium]
MNRVMAKRRANAEASSSESIHRWEDEGGALPDGEQAERDAAAKAADATEE